MGNTPQVGFRRSSSPAVDEVDFLGLLHEELSARGGRSRWTVVVDDVWCRVAPRGLQQPSQGWKLHVSATLPQAHTVLARVLPVLLDAGCAFKFAATPAEVALLNAAHTPRGNSGKFLTAYPGPEEVVALAGALHQATDGLAGPRILSDHPYRPGSLVHYRYGAFVDQRVLTNDGIYRDVVFGPDGDTREDRRQARFSPPPWAEPVFGAEPRTGPNGAGHDVLLGHRFVVREAIRHANKGGVYRAHDLDQDVDVVIKEARPHVAVTGSGADARDTLRAEARMLVELAPLGIAPQVISVFEQGGHVFLAEELIPGTVLRRWALDRVRRAGMRAHLSAALPVAEELVRLLAAVHAAGLIVRDFNPNNLMVCEDGSLRLLDVELVVRQGSPGNRNGNGDGNDDDNDDDDGNCVGVGTPGYSAPEQFAGADPAPAADLFSLGATLFFLLTGADPVTGDDDPPSRPLHRRLADWLSTGPAATALPARLHTLIGRLLDDRPHARGDLEQARDDIRASLVDWAAEAMDRHAPPAPRPVAEEIGVDGIRLDELDDAIEGIVSHLLASMTPHDADRLWPMAESGVRNDPCNVQHGAAGVLGALTHYYRRTGDSRVPEVLAGACDWIERRRRVETFRPPGLYFGSAGIAWALHDAGRALRSPEIVQRAVGLAEDLPVEWPNPDLTHGTAGLGLTALHLWQETGEETFARRAAAAAQALVQSMRRLADGPGWVTPDSFDSAFAGQHSYGFAHGNAGIGYFLLACSAAAAVPPVVRRSCVRHTVAAAQTLFGTALLSDGGARWGSGPGDAAIPLPYWCNGSAGVGSFLLRFGVATATERAVRLAERAGRSAAVHCWAGPVGQCHGIAGNAEFLLDLGALGGLPEGTAQARTLAKMIFARRLVRQGRIGFPDDGNGISAEWAGGSSGLLAFLTRLRYGGSRQWMADAAAWGEVAG